MKIIGAGWGRTGTTSVTAALEQLGAGPSVHMKQMRSHPELAASFLRYADGDAVDWRVALAGWNSSVDWPACWIWRDLLDVFPDAPVLLTLRDPDAWYDSVLNSIHPATGPGADVGPPYRRTLLDRVWQRDFGGWERVLDRDHAINSFLAHADAVRRDCPPARLVEWRVEDEWGPLCAALGVPVPDEPFPRLNSRADYARRLEARAAERDGR